MNIIKYKMRNYHKFGKNNNKNTMKAYKKNPLELPKIPKLF